MGKKFLAHDDIRVTDEQDAATTIQADRLLVHWPFKKAIQLAMNHVP